VRHFFILGTNPMLSTAEITALLDSAQFSISEMDKQALIVDDLPGFALDPKHLMRRLGGTIKIGTVIADDVAVDPQALEEIIFANLSARTAVGNVTFGFSIHSLESASRAATIAGKFRNVGMKVKRRMKEIGWGARWVKPQVGTALTSVSVGKNQMIENGGEFVVLAKRDKMIVGRTDVVQPFEEFSTVDFGRPERDTKQGMLPPKLARIMINLIGDPREPKDVALLDPFCGSGTVLTEAMQIGFRELVGSDKNSAAVAATQKNVKWLKEKGLIVPDGADKLALYPSDAREINRKLKPASIDAIVSELYLGPVRSGNETRGALQKQLDELSRLYHESLAAWRESLKPGAPVVLALPVYILGGEKHGINCKQFEALGYRPESLLSASALARLGTPETKNKGLYYGRADQRVWREIVRLRFQK
jgi:tRNA G10  N-methylase Trm11